jgi:hypothetical protein
MPDTSPKYDFQATHAILEAHYKKLVADYEHKNGRKYDREKYRAEFLEKIQQHRRTTEPKPSYSSLSQGPKVESSSMKTMEASAMENLSDTLVTCKMLNLAKQELKSEITTVRLEVKQQGKNLTHHMSHLRQDLTGDMNNLRVELTGVMNDLRLDLTHKMDLMMQKMDENQARWRVDIEEQRHAWGLIHDRRVHLHDGDIKYSQDPIFSYTIPSARGCREWLF